MIIKEIKNQLISSIINLPRFAKQIIAILCDFSLILISVIAAYYLRTEELHSIRGALIYVVFISAILSLPILWLFNVYRTFFRYSVTIIIANIFAAILIYGFLFFCIFALYVFDGVPRSIGVIQPMLLFFGICSSRILIKFLLGKKIDHNIKIKSIKKTLIYGAGRSGEHLANLLANSFEFKVLGFLDDNNKIVGQTLNGIKIYSPNQLQNLIQSKEIEIVILALPTISRFLRNKILNSLRDHKLIVHTLPNITDIFSGKIKVSDIKELEVNDILDREIVPPKINLLFQNVTSKVVLVTGAGGSIGSEICRQVAKGSPKALVLFDLNEFSLYKIYEEIKVINKNLKLFPIIADVKDENKINKILKIFKVDTIYHAAAYKHVTLVESNICAGVFNNVIGTYVIAKASIENKISNFVLVSTDKAVRPTNIMGASKRLAELCVQGLYHHYKDDKIKMAIVRFGNVLESSGSVIPKFKQQIKEGGPITLTDPKVTRFFMTITEAAQLVMQAGSLSTNCDVFVLDMGKSILIKDLVYRIVELSGLKIKDSQNPEGDIEIIITGLRPGEKLYEELLLGDNPQFTNHEKIFKAQDAFIPLSELEKNLNILKLQIIENKSFEVKKMLENILSSYKPEFKIVDYIHIEESSINDYSSNNIESVKVINIKN